MLTHVRLRYPVSRRRASRRARAGTAAPDSSASITTALSRLDTSVSAVRCYHQSGMSHRFATATAVALLCCGAVLHGADATHVSSPGSTR
eukprot:COSAG03_NODE_1151_length_4700_cov_4.480548_9_plen_90_part_00